MATGLVIHISAGENKHTEVLTSELIRVGSCEGCHLRLRSSDLPKERSADGLVLELARQNGSYRVTGFDQLLTLSLNGNQLQLDSEIQDGDQILINPPALELQFFPIRSLPAVVPATKAEPQVAPFIEAAAIESAATARRDDAKVFLREFTRELVREIKPSTKLITLAIAVALVGGLLYIGFSMFKELQRSRRLIAEQADQLAATRDQVSRTNDTLIAIDRSNREIRDSLSLAVKLRSEYGNGVCLIAGSFYFVEQGTGRPLRYPDAQMNEGATVQSDEPATLTAEGNGAVAEYEFVGTGFYVGDGFVITNRHIAQPWRADDRASSISSSVRGQPRLKKLNAYFPDHSQPIPLKFKVAAQREDLAVTTMEMKEGMPNIPVLPLETDTESVAVGRMVVMLGYPSGPDRLLASLDDAEAREIQQRYSALDSMLGFLSEKGRIQPLLTQGNITDLNPRRIAYDARTAEGGSGAPLFGQSGRVIGVNFAVFTENQASNFAVPIKYGITLLERAGWKAPVSEKKDAEATAQNNHAEGAAQE